MKTEKCGQCGRWAEPPFVSIMYWDAPATEQDAVRFLRGEDCEIKRIGPPLCRYCAYAISQGADSLTEEGKDALDLSDDD